MKSPATLLAERAAPAAPADGLKVWRDAAQDQINEPVIDACLFSHQASYSVDALASHSGPLVGMLLRKGRKIQAGGLPPHFLLVVTETEVIALRRTMTARGGALGRPGEEVARWDRAGLQVTWRDGGYLYHAVVTPASGARTVQCSVGKSPLSESFLNLLSDPTRRHPAS